MAGSRRVLEWLHRAAASQQEGVGDKLERGQIDIGFPGRRKLEEALVKLGVLGLGGLEAEFAVDRQLCSA